MDETRTMVNRLLRAREQATAAGQADVWSAFYSDANAWCADIARPRFVTAAQVAGILSAMSPQVSLGENVRCAARLIDSGRAEDGCSYRSQIDKALGILRGGPVPLEEIRDSLGRYAFKTKAFLWNIARPEDSGPVTVDRHAARIALGVSDAETAMRYISHGPGYERVADAYRRAAKRTGARPHVLQALLWGWYRDTLGIRDEPGIFNAERLAA